MFSLKEFARRHKQWHRPVVSATREVEAGGWQGQNLVDRGSSRLVRQHRLCLKIKSEDLDCRSCMYRGLGSFLISAFPVKDERKSQLCPELFQDMLSLPVHLSIKFSTVIIKKHFQST